MKNFFVNEAEDPQRLEQLSTQLADAVEKTTGNGQTKEAITAALKEAGIYKRSKYTLFLKTIVTLFAGTILTAIIGWGVMVTQEVYAMKAQRPQFERSQRAVEEYIQQNERNWDIQRDFNRSIESTLNILSEKFDTHRYLLESINRTTEDTNKRINK